MAPDPRPQTGRAPPAKTRANQEGRTHPDDALAWRLWRGRNTRSHPELGSESPQRRWYCVLRRGRAGRCQANPSPGPFPTHQCLWPMPFAAGWSSPVARQAHNLKVAGSNPAPATKKAPLNQRFSGAFPLRDTDAWSIWQTIGKHPESLSRGPMSRSRQERRFPGGPPHRPGRIRSREMPTTSRPAMMMRTTGDPSPGYRRSLPHPRSEPVFRFFLVQRARLPTEFLNPRDSFARPSRDTRR